MTKHTSTPILYMFGDALPEIWSLLSDTDFRMLVERLFQNGKAAVPEAPPACFELAQRLGFLAVEGSVYRAGTRLVPIPSIAERDLPELMRPVLAHYVEIVEEVTSDLRMAYESTEAGRCFPWAEVCHSVVAGMFLDLAMGSQLVRSGTIPGLLVGETVIWAFERISALNGFGVQSVASTAPRLLFAQLWHRRTRITSERLSIPHVQALARVAFSGEGASLPPRELLYLRHLRLVRRAGSSFKIQVPAFEPAAARQLLAVLVPAAKRLEEDAVNPALDRLFNHPWWQPRGQEDSFRHAAVRLILEYGIDRVIASRLLAPFPESGDLPASWGRWLWSEPDGPDTLMPGFVPN